MKAMRWAQGWLAQDGGRTKSGAGSSNDAKAQVAGRYRHACRQHQVGRRTSVRAARCAAFDVASTACANRLRSWSSFVNNLTYMV